MGGDRGNPRQTNHHAGVWVKARYPSSRILAPIGFLVVSPLVCNGPLQVGECLVENMESFRQYVEDHSWLENGVYIFLSPRNKPVG